MCEIIQDKCASNRRRRLANSVPVILLACPLALALAASGLQAAAEKSVTLARGDSTRLDAPMQQYVMTTEDRFLTVNPPSADSMIVGPSIPAIIPSSRQVSGDEALGGGALARVDLNGDGIDDLAIAVTGAFRPFDLDEEVNVDDAPMSSRSSRQQALPTGAVYVFFGNEENDPRFRDAVGEVNAAGWGPADVVVYGAEGDDRLGKGGIVVGDFNGDGYDDLAIGTPYGGGVNFDDPELGVVYVLFGGPAGQLGEYIYTPDGGPSNGESNANRRVESAGVIVDTRYPGGEPAIVVGTSSLYTYNGIPVVGPDIAIFPDSTSVGIDGGFAAFSYDEAMRVLDFNGDGVDDLAIGAGFINVGENVGAGGAYVLFGSDNQLVPLSGRAGRRTLGQAGIIDLTNELPGVLIAGDESFKGLTWPNQMAVGDFDGDGIADLLLGAPSGDTAFPAAHIAFGSEALSPGQTIVVSTAGDFPGTRFTGRLIEEDFNYSLFVHPTNESMDHNGDGIDDPILFNANLDRVDVAEPPMNGAGAVFVVQGGPHLRGRNLELDVIVIIDEAESSAVSTEEILLAVVGAEDDARVGGGVLSHGDFNGDGLDDLFVGAPGLTGGLQEQSENPGLAFVAGRTDAGRIVEAGRSLVGLGGTSLPDTFIPETVDLVGRSPSGIASTVAVTGDFDGDGLVDLAFGSLRSGTVELVGENPGFADFQGATYILHGQTLAMPAVVDLENLSGESPEPRIFAWYGSGGDNLNGGRRLGVLDFYQDGIDDLLTFSYGATVALPDLAPRPAASAGHILSGQNNLPAAPTGTVVRSNHAGDPLPRSHRTARAVVDFERGDSNSFTTVMLSRDSSFITGAEPLAAPVWEIYTSRFINGVNGLPGPNGLVTLKYLNREIHSEQSEENLTVLFGPTPSGPWTAISALPREQVDKDLNLLHVYFPTPLIPPDKPGDNPITPTVRDGMPGAGERRVEIPTVDDVTTAISQRQANELVGYFVIGDPGNILAVELVSFTASTDGIGHPVLLEWETALEIDNAGFYIVRASQVGGAWSGGEPVTPTMIGAKGSAATYSFLDNKPMQGGETRAYLLLDVDVTGQRTSHGPAMVIVPEAASSVRDWALY